jgi:conjugative relaxase-like TrwC/TraI family protein
MAYATTLFSSLSRSAERHLARLPTPAAWRATPALAPFKTVDGVFQATRTARPPAERRPVLTALLSLAPADTLASEVFLAALVPALRSVAVQLCHWSPAEADEVDALVAAGAWEAVSALGGTARAWPDRAVVCRARDFARARLVAESRRRNREVGWPTRTEAGGLHRAHRSGGRWPRHRPRPRRLGARCRQRPGRPAHGTPRLGRASGRAHVGRACAPRGRRARGGLDGTAQGGAGTAPGVRRGGGVMLTIAAISSEGYYLKEALRHIDEYYTGGESEGRWVGGATKALGLEGKVGPEGLGALLQGLSPADRSPMYSPHAAARRSRAGFDLTFSAPKGVSLIALLGGADLRAKVVSAHEAAVADALGYLEAEAAFVRRGKDGLVRLPAEGFVGAAFVHTTSRLGDPQLHTHLVTPNLAKGLDGAWSALDARALYRHARTAGFLYQVSLRAGLTEALGLSWRPVERGMAEPSGIPKEVLSHFSRRRAEIEEALRLAGQNSAAAANIAAHRTRRPKDHDISPEALRTSWQVRAESIGFGPEHLAGLVQEPRIPEAFDLTEQAARLLGPEGLTERTSTFGRQDVLRSLASAAREGARVDELQAIAGELLTDPRAVPLRPVRGRNMESGPWLLRRQDTSGRITHVGLRPAAALTEVTVETPEASGMAVELASDHPGVSQPLSSHPATEQGGLRKLTVEFSGELPRNAWVLLKRDRTWVDRRFLNWGYRTGADEDIEEVVERQAELEALVSLGEGPNIEFKVELPPRQAGSEALNFLRTVAAFANGQGGRILFGVSDDGDVLGLLRNEAESRTRDRITELVRATVTPLPNYSLELYDVEGRPERVVLGLQVQSGPEPPYGVKPGNPTYYVRRGATTFPASSQEVRYLARSRPETAQEARLPWA